MMCGKKCFSKTYANKVKKGRKISRITKKKIRLYFCHDCNSWHLTTHSYGKDLN